MLSNIIIFLLLFLVSCNHKSSSISVDQTVFILIGLIICLLFAISLLVARKRIKTIKQAYQNSKQQLHFWDKLDRLKLEKDLRNNKLPEEWVFSLNQDKTKIEDIYFYNGLSVGRIAQDKEKLYKSLRSRISKQ